MDTDVLLIAIVVASAVAGLLLTVVPVFPGALVVLAGAIACAVIDRGDAFGWWFWVVQAALVVLYLVVDNVAQVFGVKRVGGTRAAMLGGAIGVLVGPLVLVFVSGPFALLLGPPIGAVVGTLVGEAIARGRVGRGAASADTAPATDMETAIDRRHYARLSGGALVAWMISVPTKLLLLGMQLVLLVLAVW